MDNGQCRYRSEGGLSCAVGCLIPDEKYNESLEGKTILDPEVWGLFQAEETGLLSSLQDVHDCFTPSCWCGELLRVARRFGLNTAVLVPRK